MSTYPPLEGPYGPVARSLLDMRDSKLRRCTWCGSWVYDRQDCGACETPADVKREAS